MAKRKKISAQISSYTLTSTIERAARGPLIQIIQHPGQFIWVKLRLWLTTTIQHYDLQVHTAENHGLDFMVWNQCHCRGASKKKKKHKKNLKKTNT